MPHRHGVSNSRGRILSLLDGSGVDRLWIAGAHVNWETGAFDGGQVSATGSHTHCSAFVAAMAKRAGIYILRPPQHAQLHLADAEADWLADRGPSRGWYRLSDETTAQTAANDGRFVLVSYKSKRESIPGHIAVIRPHSESHALVGAGGPQIAQAGLHNFASGSLDRGFGTHRWSCRFFACNLP